MEKLGYGSFPEELTVSVSCASGVESVLKKEVRRLAGIEVPAINGRLEFAGDPLFLCRCNLNLRTAERVYVKTGEFTVFTFDELFDAAKSLRWEDFIPPDGKVYVDGK